MTAHQRIHYLLDEVACPNGEYGTRDLFIGVPVKLGEGGLEEIFEFKLSDMEQAAPDHSADAVNSLVADIKRLG